MAHQWIQGPSEKLEESDRRLFFRVRNALWDYEPLRASGAELAVEIEHGVVYVSGRTRTRAQQQLITAYLLRVDGVSGVQNTVVSDPEVARDVAQALASDSDLAPSVIYVDSQLGTVRLAGDVPSQAAAERASAIAGGLGIAKSIENRLVISPMATAN